MRHLVTGGAGFVGSHLIDRLIRVKNDSVICLDSFQTGQQQNIDHWLGDPRFRLIHHDVREPMALDVDCVWHLACPASPLQYQRDPIATCKINMLGTLNMLELAKGCGARFLLASTSEVYGDPLVSPQPENYLGNVNCTGPRACYDEGKRIAEALTFDYERVHGLSVRVARIFNTYGPRMSASDGRVVSTLMHQALAGEPLSVYGDGSQSRSFCYVDDLVTGLILLMQSDYSRPVNLGNPEELKIIELAAIILARINPGLPVQMRPLPVDDPRQRRPSIELAQRILGWSPQVSLQEGLERTLAAITSASASAMVATC